ncbi:O-methyltransferase [Streptomyces sp. PTM05]|uniref:O-methyltransferase n=1 Tax=Streptantibioticus parmotrematis TaxID=2873249 RepID=A0ABS7QRT5_9ACTN|nr:O-methyltransferase [Streptantibioticus parmotrematis]MBY8885466.1 O-methyltransferase [Streptantibioticus parmotrematis]
MEEQWAAIDTYANGLLVDQDEALRNAAGASREAGLPEIAVSPGQGKFLHLLALTNKARRILEIGTFGGYSTIWLARALPPDGLLVTCEREEDFAKKAWARIEAAGVADRVDLRTGKALETLPALEAEGLGPFDLVFVDADKAGIPDYFTWALKLSRPGTVIIVDNVVLEGAVTDATSPNPAVQGVRRFHEMVAAEPRVSATTIQTVGVRGHDGFTYVLVTG